MVVVLGRRVYFAFCFRPSQSPAVVPEKHSISVGTYTTDEKKIPLDMVEASAPYPVYAQIGDKIAECPPVYCEVADHVPTTPPPDYLPNVENVEEKY